MKEEVDKKIKQVCGLHIQAPLILLLKFPPEEGDVCDGEAEGVDLGEALLVGEGRHVQPQLLERRVDARRAAQHKIRYKDDRICGSRFCPMKKVGQWRNCLARAYLNLGNFDPNSVDYICPSLPVIVTLPHDSLPLSIDRRRS